MQGSNLPNRRLMGSWNLPVRRLGMGDWQAGTVDIDLYPDQLAVFLSRHPDTAAIVDQFNLLVQRFGYYQGKPGYPIPEYGIAVADNQWGEVTIFPDATGTLQFTGKVPSTVAAQINKPPFVSPLGDDGIPWTAVLWIAGGLLGVSVLNTVRGR